MPDVSVYKIYVSIAIEVIVLNVILENQAVSWLEVAYFPNIVMLREFDFEPSGGQPQELLVGHLNELDISRPIVWLSAIGEKQPIDGWVVSAGLEIDIDPFRPFAKIGHQHNNDFHLHARTRVGLRGRAA